jgi:hypothetical protein
MKIVQYKMSKGVTSNSTVFATTQCREEHARSQAAYGELVMTRAVVEVKRIRVWAEDTALLCFSAP